MKSKIGIMVLAVMTIWVAEGLAQAQAPKVSQVVYITKSKACGCSAEQVKVADKVISQAFPGPRQTLLKRIDYDTDRQAALPYIGEFRLIQLPALLFLDSQGHLLWRAPATLSLKEVEGKLKEFGV